MSNRWDPGVIRALAEARHGDAFAVLGAHRTDTGRVLRTYLPGAERISAVLDDGQTIALEAGPEPGLFAGDLPAQGGYRLRIGWPGGEQD
ncbi:GlgB N-terminal domain-containing protein, partial [Xanthomonas oryzae]